MKQKRVISRSILAVVLISVVWFASGCQSPMRFSKEVPAYQPANVVVNPVAMERVVQRVAVLPVHIAEAEARRQMTSAMLRATLSEELVKRGAFESFFISPDELKGFSGQGLWRPGDELPAAFFSELAERYHCQAVLFPSVNHYHPYPPQTIAWRMKMVDTDSLETIWEIDEFFDAGDVTVARAAEVHYARYQSGGTRHQDERAVFSSPRRFGQYTVASVLQTMPF